MKTKTKKPAELSGKDVEQRVRELLEKKLSEEKLRLKVKVQYWKNEHDVDLGDYWYILVEPEQEPAKPFQYYEILAEVEIELKRGGKGHEGINVAIVPTVSD